MSVNKYICDGTVFTEDSVTETFTTDYGDENPPIDPEGTAIAYSKSASDLEEAVYDAANELTGDA